MTADTSKSSNRFSAWHALVLAAGLLVFVLLIFANKTHLPGEKEAGLAQDTSTHSPDDGHNHGAATASDLLASLPVGDPNPSADSLVQALNQTQDPAGRATILQGLVKMYRDGGRLDFAAVYAGALADEQPQVRNHIVAGALFRNAGFLEHVQADSLMFRRLSDEALRHLRNAEQMETNNEDALLELGLAMAESRQPGLGMEGVMKIRRVTEINPKNVEALYRLGVFSMDTKQWDKAENRFRQVLDLEPGNHSAKFLLALACKELGKNDEFGSLLRAVSLQKEDQELAARAKEMLNQPK